MCLGASYCLGMTSLTHHIDSLANAYWDLEWLEVFIESHQHTWVDSTDKCVDKIVRLSEDNCHIANVRL